MPFILSFLSSIIEFSSRYKKVYFGYSLSLPRHHPCRLRSAQRIQPTILCPIVIPIRNNLSSCHLTTIQKQNGNRFTFTFRHHRTQLTTNVLVILKNIIYNNYIRYIYTHRSTECKCALRHHLAGIAVNVLQYRCISLSFKQQEHTLSSLSVTFPFNISLLLRYAGNVFYSLDI